MSPHAGLAPLKAQLPNGLTLVVKETRKTPIVAVNIAVRAGAVSDPPGCPGAANLLARVIDRGTASRSATDVAEAFDSRGVSLTVNPTRHLMTFVCTCLAADVDAILAAVADVIRNPTIPPAELATRKGEVATAITQDADNPFFRATEGLMAALYSADHPYGRPLKGSLAALERISRDALLDFHRQWFAPAAVSAVIVGDVSAAAAQASVARAFGGWDVHARDPVNIAVPPPVSHRTTTVLPMMSKAQADVAYGFITVARSDPRYYAYWLANHVIGQYAIGGRLGDRIRERQGMAYYAGTVFEANIAPGPLFVRAGVSAANIDHAIASIDEELARASDEGITQDELDNSRNYLIGSMPRTLETNHGIANFLQTNETFGLGLDYDVRVSELLHRVTLEAANEAVREAFDPSRATVVIAGPYTPNPQVTKSSDPQIPKSSD